MEKVEGFVDHIVFRNEDNGYTVLSLIVEEEELTCVGTFALIHEGEYIEAEGTYSTHPVYGEQFQVESFLLKEPEDLMSMERYLGSGAIKGIGAALASRIVRRFKEDTFRIMEEEPERLAEVKGISLRKSGEIANQVVAMKDQRQAIMFLQQYGITLQMSVKLYQQYRMKIYEIIQTNPYQLAEDVSGIGFKIADEIAEKAGIKRDSEFRIRSGILYTLLQASMDGHTYLPEEELTMRARALLLVEESRIEEQYMDLSIDRKIVRKEAKDGIHVYAAVYDTMENNVAVMLHQLNLYYDIPDIEIEDRIRKIEKETKMQLDEMQVMAVKEAVRNGLMIITGGPGTGKTTTINTIIHYFEKEGMDIYLAAPTGRAAKRMSETTGCEARTIHRMLELSGAINGNKDEFERNEQNPLETDVIIIDEMSMVDITLMNSLLKAIMAGTRLILVGDVNQLPSVGPGCILKDMIDSNRFPTVKLTKIFRQASQSDIIVNAHKINDGQEVILDNKSKDFFFLKRYDPNVVINVVLQLVYQKMPKYVDADMYEIQVLTPMRKGALGVENLNQVLQKYLNPADPKKEEKEYGTIVFREGDKVMQTKNNYQLEWEINGNYGLVIEKGTGIFNGDMGVIKKINHFAETMTIEFDEKRLVEYAFRLLDELELAYAITIHKSQGSEYPAVVIPLLGGPKMLMNRNLLYTAVTRARKCVTLVGNEETFREMEGNLTQQKRYSGLCQRIQEVELTEGECYL